MDTSTRLRIATRIHFALLRHYGEKVEIGALMKGAGDVREAMWVCEASGDAELASLARRLGQGDRSESAAAARAPAARAAAPQDAAWARNTSGFGVSRPLELEDTPEAASSWLRPSSWMRRSAASGRG